ncbi:MAG: hypothetical protein OHM56_08160 [Spiroplasma phoeniceum]|nr:MAG: hypothetical protein OHM57_07565 [Spiroplasma phoeniceum]UZQ31595.1 MAG: hypothetical protein OHM56_08160 [Spiroplasma phoeniceum]
MQQVFRLEKHDYALFKESKISILKNTKLIVDSGYLSSNSKNSQ